MIVDILRIGLGVIFVLFLPGYLLSIIILKGLENLERIGISIGLSITLVAALGFLLTYIGKLIDMRLITTLYVWISLLSLSIIFGVVILAVNRYKLAAGS